jgi:uncharacterized RDD family membrane protein YckC
VSTSPSQINLSPAWKQEVNRRVAAHRSRKGSPAAAPEACQEALSEARQGSGGRRAAEAAARVAARYANAPSYSQMLAGEARAAVRAAEAASRAALEAHAAAQYVLAGLEAVSGAEPAWELQGAAERPPKRQQRPTAAPARTDAPHASQAVEKQSLAILWEPDFPERKAEPAEARLTRAQGTWETHADEWTEPAPRILLEAEGGEIEVVETAEPIHANLIEFPRELVATRKVRPRLAEGPFAASREPGAQLSIFEVDPGEISILTGVEQAVEAAPAPAWTGPEWSGIELDAQSPGELVEEAAPQPETVRTLEPAPMSRRMMAAVVDGALIAGAFLVAAFVAASNARGLPPLRAVELSAAAALTAIAVLYQALFLTLARGTPGMKYAQLSLCTFDGRFPTRAQRRGRLGALLLSLLPVGLGVVWILFDEDHLSWHDRLSRTYLRKSE